jgi:hypothetical protein
LCKFLKPWYIQKSNLYSERNFSFTFGPIGPAASQPIRPFGPAVPTSFFFLPQSAAPLSPLGLSLSADPARHHGPTGRLLPPPAPEQSAHATTASWPHTTPMVGPRRPPPVENNGRISPPSFPPLSGTLPPLQSPITGAFNPGALKLLQRRPLKAPGLPQLTSAL